MVHLIVDNRTGRRRSACGSYVGGASAHRKNVTCPECLEKTQRRACERCSAQVDSGVQMRCPNCGVELLS